ncbi:carbohydrate-binding family 9-like protein [Olivibacter ginsenosidimutans]|uniref:Carbohydrate-binding family 9-like protein n=2 Tax=Olivibacter ginsenosidimutans TaxID=1176537 RepID=A0ABP9AZ92_9SPHI
MQLIIPYVSDINLNSSGVALRESLRKFESHPIARVNWQVYPYTPAVVFKIAHNLDGIILQYQVNERCFKACYTGINEPVYKDSCVEFFISWDQENYYNFEFNGIGTVLAGYGQSDKASRIFLPEVLIEAIETDATIHGKKGDFTWDLFIHIPFNTFVYDQLETIKGKKCTGNFYKCGDDLPVPHFLSWNAIDAPEPNFHLPEFFGELVFGE